MQGRYLSYFRAEASVYAGVLPGGVCQNGVYNYLSSHGADGGALYFDPSFFQ